MLKMHLRRAGMLVFTWRLRPDTEPNACLINQFTWTREPKSVLQIMHFIIFLFFLVLYVESTPVKR